MSGGTIPFANPGWWLAGAHLARVRSVQDPNGTGRVQVQIHATDPDESALLWARVATCFAGDNYGAFFIPDVDEEVLVVFVGNDARYPVVIGAMWTGAHELPEDISGENVDRWTITGKGGTRIAIVEESSGQEKVEISTPGGASATLTDANGGEIVLTVGTNTMTMDSSGISFETANEFSVQASTIKLRAPSVTVTALNADFSGQTSSKKLTTASVVSAMYSQGIGNMW
jgi:uncharacterized protein involved in type VI secretion and phage assembly